MIRTPDMPRFQVGDTVEITRGEFAGRTGVIQHIDHLIFVTAYAVYIAETDTVLFGTADDLRFVSKGHSAEPTVPPHGMTAESTADYIGEFVRFCQSRIRGVGQEQYDEGTHQKFEGMALDELIEGAVEELADTVNYSAFMAIRLRRVQAALREHL